MRFLLGDVDDDGEILAYDAALALQHSVGMDPLPEADPIPWAPWRDSTANIDGQGGITAYDAGLILQYSVGIESFTGTVLKAAPVSDITVEQVGLELVFHSFGDLVGLNVAAVEGKNLLGTPDFLHEELLTAVNRNAENYRIGLCTASPVQEGTAIMSIPVLQPGRLILDLDINDRAEQVTIDLITAIARYSDQTWSVYPNPADEILYIEGLEGPAAIEIFDLQGRSLVNKKLGRSEWSVDIGGLSSGTYLIRINTGDESKLDKFMVR
jgi:hypothetical protein